jgi:hypothetical protein
MADDAGAMLMSGKPGVIDVARLGARVGVGIIGDGILGTVTFKRIGAGDPRIELASVEARDRANAHVGITFRNVSIAVVPTVTSFERVAPNPFRSSTMMSFGLARGGAVSLAVYSVDGRLVKQLVRGTREAGAYNVMWDGRDESGANAAAGVYWARLVTPQGTFSRSMVYLK